LYTIAIVINTLVVALFAALKYYSNTIGPNPEEFSLSKFAPILIISVLVGIGLSLSTGGSAMEVDQIVTFISENFMLVIFINTLYSIIMKKLAP